MNSPYRRRHVMPPELEAAWAAYEAANARAAEQYAALPISTRRWLMTHPCQRCAEQTYDPERVCWACRAVERWAS